MTMRQRLIELLYGWANKENDGINAESLTDYLLAKGVIILPCAIDTKVWVLGQPCGGCPYYNEPMTEQFIEECRNCKQWEIGECNFDYELIPEFGKLVFLTKEEAEAELQRKAARSNDKENI